YFRGIENLFDLYLPICDNWMIINNTNVEPVFIARGNRESGEEILSHDIWETMKKQKYES
ncbi:MAG: hypothetical protein WCY86_09890, partial [Spirosomataceae bacterium]